MKRISAIETAREAAIEHYREDLRDRRWRRHRQQLVIALLLVCTVAVDPGLVPRALQLLLAYL